MALLGVGGYQLHQFRLGLSPHLESAAARRLDIQTSELLYGFVAMVRSSGVMR